jgi:hypothetical protein
MSRAERYRVNSYHSPDLGLLMNFMGRPVWTATDVKSLQQAIRAIDDGLTDLHPADLILIGEAGYPDLDSVVDAARTMAAEWIKIDRRPATMTFVADKPREMAGVTA